MSSGFYFIYLSVYIHNTCLLAFYLTEFFFKKSVIVSWLFTIFWPICPVNFLSPLTSTDLLCLPPCLIPFLLSWFFCVVQAATTIGMHVSLLCPGHIWKMAFYSIPHPLALSAFLSLLPPCSLHIGHTDVPFRTEHLALWQVVSLCSDLHPLTEENSLRLRAVSVHGCKYKYLEDSLMTWPVNETWIIDSSQYSPDLSSHRLWSWLSLQGIYSLPTLQVPNQESNQDYISYPRIVMPLLHSWMYLDMLWVFI